MNRPDDARCRQVFNAIEAFVERRYGIPILITDVPSPFTGDLDGARILVDYDVDAESALFIVAHLFGHTVQWNLDPAAREIGTMAVTNPSDELLGRLRAYEQEACRYSVQLFHEAGVHDLDQWLADFAACDFAYLDHFYRTGEKRDFRSFWKENQPLLPPLPIPNFVPAKWHSRWEGIVV
jgi:hypothetical protein